ncbi:MAG: methyltransferase domain-containing protein [Anaerolineae bacterium]|nr:methyltransferase domain-containing protein [Anaerolineae bacterium]
MPVLPKDIHSKLRCPVCHSPHLEVGDNELVCQNESCHMHYPLIDGVPVLINEANSVFSIQDFVEQRARFFSDKRPGLPQRIARLVPSADIRMVTARNLARLSSLLLEKRSHPSVLVIGAGPSSPVRGRLAPEIDVLETDVSLGPTTAMICDAHDLPFVDGSFDGVIIQAVLEHVVDPYRCAAEIHRVLDFDGIVYAETPFMQQVHGGRYDFTRFTYLGHRRLFRHFAEIESGAAGGPGKSLAWSYQYFLLSFVTSRGWLRSLVNVFARLTSFWFTYFDYLLLRNPGALDAASELYFVGRKADGILSDRDLLKTYRGLDTWD